MNSSLGETVNISEVGTSESELFTYTKPEGRFLVYYHVEIVLCILTIITNGITILVIACNVKLRILSNVYFASLAVSDFAQGVFGIVFNAARIRGVSSGNWHLFDGASSQVLQFLWWFATDFSYCCLILIAIERWVFIAHPMVYKRHWTVRITVAGLTAAGAISFTFSYLAVCKDLVKVNVRYVFPSVHTLLSCLIFSAYFHIIAIAYRQQKAISRTEVGLRRGSVDSMHSLVCRAWRALRMSLIVFTMYFFTVSPWTYFQAVQSWLDPSPVKDEISQVLNTVTCLHFFSNFFVYACQNKDFSDVLKLYLSKIFLRKNKHSQPAEIYTINDVMIS
ncbi:D(1B) dopamine receptor [Biomphalaria pfeifferi]|uniref:D(1B) dopamine receptor n=1 Tax=Biomphalaria pfeifferi TaxID=112525 RepID=A0AAD8BD65_BIOPF|nr:D(1B) dopamine receptor [Biomphalaria pfeifferi]